ncbi:MAG: PAS domain S-box protein, partial [Actinomycetota bacterium]|nr:PAS domain S-box protein [Actinomycetota bacterium]
YWRKDGSAFPVEYASNPVFEDGEVKGAVVTFSDVTERKRAEEELRESEERFRTLFDRSADALLVHDEEGRMLDCNSEACRTLGYAREELLSLHVKDFAGGLLSREEKKERENAGGTPWQRAMRGEPDASGIVHYGEHKRKDGTSFPVEVRFGSVDYGGKRTILASVRDITERREAQEALRRTEERFRSLVQNSSDVITVIAPDGTILYQTPSMKRILGHEPEDRVGKNVFENPLIHPDDAARQRDLIDRTVRDPSLNPVFEAQLRHGDGSWRWVEGVVTNLLSDPNVGGIVLNARDIGERKRAEEALEESEQRYRSLFDHHPDAVYAFDLKGCFLSANPACERLTGYTAGELCRRSYVPFIVPEDLERTMRHFEGAARGEPQNYEIAITDKLGAASNST